MDKKNAKQWPKIKTAKFLTAGLVSYKDVDAGVALLKNETINTSLETFDGKPVLIDHNEVTPENYGKFRKGNVISARFNPQDGWYYVDFIVDDDTAIDLIENQGYSVSCAYNVLDVADGGLYQDLPYDGEITKIYFTHLALVKEPRYEESKILGEMPLMMVNSKGTLIKAHNISKQEEKQMFKLFQKNKDGEQKEVESFAMVNDKKIPLEDLVKAYIENTKDGKTGDMDSKELYQAKDDDIVDVNGNKVRIGEMKNAYIKMMNDKDEKMKEGDTKDKGDGVEDKKNEKKDEQEKDVEGESKERKKTFPEGAEEEEEKRSKKNAKKQGDEFFAQLSEAENSKDSAQEEFSPAPRFGFTREERANSWKKRVHDNMAAR